MNVSPPIASPSQAAASARAADGDYKTKGVGHEVRDADGDYKPQKSASSAPSASPQINSTVTASISSGVQSALLSLQKGA